MTRCFIFNQTDCPLSKKLTKKISKIIKLTCSLGHQQIKSQVAIILTTPAQQKKISLKYQAKAIIPDVLAFPAQNQMPLLPKLKVTNLGDVFVCIEKTKAQAVVKKVCWEHELLFLVVHGVLHLCGYHHQTNQQQNQIYFFHKAIFDTMKIFYPWLEKIKP